MIEQESFYIHSLNPKILLILQKTAAKYYNFSPTYKVWRLI